MTVKQKKELYAMVGALNRRITRGMAYLDKRFGRAKWLERIDESRLDLQDGTVCVTGQTFEDNWDGFFGESIKKLSRHDLDYWQNKDDQDDTEKAAEWEEKGHKYAANLGFYLTEDDEDRGYNWDILTRLWHARLSVMKIEAGLAIKGPPPVDKDEE